jgi:hypothetical protein
MPVAAITGKTRRLDSIEVPRPEAIEPAFAQLESDRLDAAFVSGSPLFNEWHIGARAQNTDHECRRRDGALRSPDCHSNKGKTHNQFNAGWTTLLSE